MKAQEKHWESQYRHQTNKYFVPAPSKLNYLPKRNLLLGDKIFNNLAREIKNFADNLKKNIKLL